MRGIFAEMCRCMSCRGCFRLSPPSVLACILAKGVIAVGADADFALVDMSRGYTLLGNDLFYRHKHSPYVGRTFGCRVKATFCRGNKVYELGEGVTETADGTWLRPAVIVGGEVGG